MSVSCLFPPRSYLCLSHTFSTATHLPSACGALVEEKSFHQGPNIWGQDESAHRTKRRRDIRSTLSRLIRILEVTFGSSSRKLKITHTDTLWLRVVWPCLVKKEDNISWIGCCCLVDIILEENIFPVALLITPQNAPINFEVRLSVDQVLVLCEGWSITSECYCVW